MVARFGVLRIGLLEMLVYRWKHAMKNRHQRMDNSYRCPGHSNLPERYPGTSRPKTALRLYQFPKNLGGKRTLSDKAILSFFEMVRSQGPAFLGRRTSRRTKRLSSNFAGTVGAGSTLTTSSAPTDTTWGWTCRLLPRDSWAQRQRARSQAPWSSDPSLSIDSLPEPNRVPLFFKLPCGYLDAWDGDQTWLQ